MKIKERYIDPFTDFGFKKIFGSEPNSDLLIDFLNELLKGEKHIRELRYLKNEHLGKTHEYRKAVLDLYCEDDKGEKFIIELQKVNNIILKTEAFIIQRFQSRNKASRATDGTISSTLYIPSVLWISLLTTVMLTSIYMKLNLWKRKLTGFFTTN